MSSQRQRKKHSQMKKKRYDAKEKGDKIPQEVRGVRSKETTKESKSNRESSLGATATVQTIKTQGPDVSAETTPTTSDERRGGRAVYSRHTIDSSWDKYQDEEVEVGYTLDEEALEQRMDQLLSLCPPELPMTSSSSSLLPDMTSQLLDTETTGEGVPSLTLNLENVASLLSSLPLHQELMLDEMLFNLCYEASSCKDTHTNSDASLQQGPPSSTVPKTTAPVTSSIIPPANLTFKSVEHPSALASTGIIKTPEVDESKNLDTALETLLDAELDQSSRTSNRPSETSEASPVPKPAIESVDETADDLDSMLDDLLNM